MIYVDRHLAGQVRHGTSVFCVKWLRFFSLLALLCGCSAYDKSYLNVEDGSTERDGSVSRDSSTSVDSARLKEGGDGSGNWGFTDANGLDSSGTLDGDELDGDNDSGSEPDATTECEPGFDDCDNNPDNGCETSLNTTVSHCGACGNDCDELLAHTEQTSCTDGNCNIVDCERGWGDCDSDEDNGCEHEIAVDGPCVADPDCVMQSYDTHEYYFCSTESSWSAARVTCQSYTYGDLVSISSDDENDFIESNLTDNAWIGARDTLVEGLWRWDSSSIPFWRGVAAGSVQLDQYQNWSEAQPDDTAANENCAEISSSDGTWSDSDCIAELAFVCEVSEDECPDNSEKVDPGQCGCDDPDTDDDADGFAVCNDSCDADPNKQNEGQCGCGKADTDSDGDGAADCNDGCPVDPTHTGECLGYSPRNFNPTSINFSAQPNTTLDCGTTTVDSTDPDGSGPKVATISNWCGTAPTLIAQNQTDGPQVVVIPLHSLTISSGNTLRLIGSRPVILAVDGDVTIAGTIDASANGVSPGAGGNWSCDASQGGDGSGGSGNYVGASGGGGGGFGTAGGQGGRADDDADFSFPPFVVGDGVTSSGGSAGQPRSDTDLVPLMGGCAGGAAGGCGTTRAAGGGAVQISSGGALDVTGSIRANGGIGSIPCGTNEEGGGTGGGSGGGILLERTDGSTSGTLQANGGNGGGNGSGCGYYEEHCCADHYYPYTGSTSSNNPGQSAPNTDTACNVNCSTYMGNTGQICDGGGPGGGGGYGVIKEVMR